MTRWVGHLRHISSLCPVPTPSLMELGWFWGAEHRIGPRRIERPLEAGGWGQLYIRRAPKSFVDTFGERDWRWT
jgi:hypothetical protein